MLLRFFVMLSLVVASSSVFAQDIVREDGGGGAFTSIQAAIAGGSNPVISVQQTNTGILDATVSVTRSVTIQNDTGGNVVLTNSSGHAVEVTMDETVVVSDFEIANATGAGVRVSAQHADVTVMDCFIHDNDGDDIANWDNVRSAEVICEGAGDTLIPGEAETAAITTTVTLLRCTVEGGNERLGSAVVGWYGTLNIVDCPLISAHPGGGSGNFDINRCVVGMGAGSLNLENSKVSLRGATDTVIVNHIGFLSYVSDQQGWAFNDTLNIDRCVLEVNTDVQVTVSNGVRFVHLGVTNMDRRAQATITNTVLNFNGLGDSNSNGFWIQEAVADINYCTLLGDNNGSNQGGRRGITCDSGQDQFVQVANTMFGNWGEAAAGNDLPNTNNGIVASYCHLWNNGANFGGLGPLGSIDNCTYDEPPFLNEKYEITVEHPEFTDGGLSTLIAPPASVTADVDEAGVRPRGAANDKGAQEGMAPLGTPTPTKTPSTGVSDWEHVYR